MSVSISTDVSQLAKQSSVNAIPTNPQKRGTYREGSGSLAANAPLQTVLSVTGSGNIAEILFNFGTSTGDRAILTADGNLINDVSNVGLHYIDAMGRNSSSVAQCFISFKSSFTVQMQGSSSGSNLWNIGYELE